MCRSCGCPSSPTHGWPTDRRRCHCPGHLLPAPRTCAGYKPSASANSRQPQEALCALPARRRQRQQTPRRSPCCSVPPVPPVQVRELDQNSPPRHLLAWQQTCPGLCTWRTLSANPARLGSRAPRHCPSHAHWRHTRATPAESASSPKLLSPLRRASSLPPFLRVLVRAEPPAESGARSKPQTCWASAACTSWWPTRRRPASPRRCLAERRSLATLARRAVGRTSASAGRPRPRAG
mmetsp:Transcript_52078/g.121084  ORF Transcript_52078/g.121084 Transcript_52078/m.121084 type:complete len:236 (+) Transcript_52078:81-788(+)